VVGRIENDKEMIQITKLVTRVLDYGIELTQAPDIINSEHNNRYRTIGIGIQGLHDYLVKNNTTYNNIEFIGETTELISYASIEASIELAKEKGHYPAFKGSRWDTGEQIAEYKNFSKGKLDWNRLQELIEQYGIRNSQLMSPAPNTSTSIFMDAAAGVMPVYAGFFREDNSTGKFPVSAMHLKQNPLGYAKAFHQHEQHHLVKVIGEMQKFIDTGISAEFIFDLNKENFSAKELYDLINLAWKNGMKSIYYIRSIKKGSTIEDVMGITESSCVGCAG
jgi:ribonucleoside-diphosphate reductase alpha chain